MTSKRLEEHPSCDPHPEARIAEIREREQKATDGPWTNGVRGSGSSGDAHMCQVVARRTNEAGVGVGEVVAATWHHKYTIVYVGLSRQQCVDNAEFVAHARQDIPFLLDTLSVLEQRVKELQEQRDEAKEAFQEMRDAAVAWEDQLNTAEHRLEAAEATLARLRELPNEWRDLASRQRALVDSGGSFSPLAMGGMADANITRADELERALASAPDSSNGVK